MGGAEGEEWAPHALLPQPKQSACTHGVQASPLGGRTLQAAGGCHVRQGGASRSPRPRPALQSAESTTEPPATVSHAPHLHPAHRLTCSRRHPGGHVAPNHRLPVQLCLSWRERGCQKASNVTVPLFSGSPRGRAHQLVRVTLLLRVKTAASVRVRYITTRPQHSVAEKNLLFSIMWVGRGVWAGLP